ncbi:unnamed protein product [Brachionus calyciflorus]|uniref:non-specific serine/threonine protein kinase n=1 Tax=Brachionus calyciflorus TaxID=104777 RepID=A0A813VDM6_9BILA|nr:unnamed protein product [Brachionus calyciflorus]
MSEMEICTDTHVGSWEFANVLGEGAYGEVKLALNSKTQETRAVKIISLNLLSDKNSIQKEVLIHKSLNHENVVKFYSSFQHLDKFYIILEYASGGELFDRIEPDLGMDVELAHKYFTQLINGVEYLHSKGIVHRDIKPENLLLNDMDQIKIADFGLATLFQYRGNERLLTSPCGTAPYVAPEVLSQSSYKAQPTDVWSCGIVLVAMLAGELPWDKPVADCYDFVAWVKNNYQKSPWCKIENTALSLIRNILSYEPSQRFTIKQVKSSTWYTKTYKTNKTYEPIGFSQNSMAFLSQPTHFYLNSNQTNGSVVLDTGLEVMDSQASCRCSSTADSNPGPFNNITNHIESFSQPASIDNMYLNSQNNATQYSQYSQATSQSPLLKLVKRMTRMFVHLTVDNTCLELSKLLKKFMYDYKENVMNERQRQITVSTCDKRQTLLTFKINISEMKSQHEVLVDFRLSKGDGLEFKKIFIKFKTALNEFACKRYIFQNGHGCCARNF